MQFTYFRLLVVSFSVVVCSSTAMAGGWLSRATGGRIQTPEVIRKIAPNGVSVRDRQQMSYIPEDPGAGYEKQIASDGTILSRRRGESTWKRTNSKATFKVINGQKYWVSGDRRRYIGPAQPLFPKQQQNSKPPQQGAGYPQFQNPYTQFNTGLTPQQQQQKFQQQQSMRQWNQMQQRHNQIYYNTMQNSINNINRALQQQQQQRGW